MTQQEITKALRWLANETEFIFAADTLRKAANKIERLQAENATLKKALENRLNELESVQCKDETETYTTGYRNGHRNGQIELIRYVLCMPDGVKERADNEIAR